MAGTKAGGRKAAETNKRKYGDDFYAKIGSEGGKLGKTGGFAYVESDGTEIGRQRAVMYGVIGGKKSRRGKANG